MTTDSKRLTLRELEPLARLRAAWLLALDRAGVARQKTQVAQLAPVRFVERHERTGDSEAKCAGLARLPATVHVGADIEPAERVGCRERLLNGRHQRGTREVVA